MEIIQQLKSASYPSALFRSAEEEEPRHWQHEFAIQQGLGRLPFPLQGAPPATQKVIDK